VPPLSTLSGHNIEQYSSSTSPNQSATSFRQYFAVPYPNGNHRITDATCFRRAGASEALVDQYKSLFLKAIARQLLQHLQNAGFCYCCDIVKKRTVPTQLGMLAPVKDEDTFAMAGARLVQMVCQRPASDGVGLLQTSLEISRELLKSPFNASTTLTFDSNLQFRGQRLANSAIFSALLASHGRMGVVFMPGLSSVQLMAISRSLNRPWK
jgi:hypothetical protein